MKKKIKYKKKAKKAAEINPRDKLDRLQETLDYFEDELEGNADYIENELSRKWHSKEKIKKREKEKPARQFRKPASKEELNKLQKISSYFEKKLNRNEDYVKKELPKKWAGKAKTIKRIKIKTEEKPMQKSISEEKINKLQESLDYIEKELEENKDYVERELPKKWAFKTRPKSGEIKEKHIMKVKKAVSVSKEELAMLHKTAEHFKGKLADNIHYLKEIRPEKFKVVSYKLNELIEERKRILAEITDIRNELKSLEDERIRLEKDVFRREAEEQNTQLQKYEQSIGKELSRNISLFKSRKPIINITKIKKTAEKKVPSARKKTRVVSEQELDQLQDNLDKLNQELKSIDEKTK